MIIAKPRRPGIAALVGLLLVSQTVFAGSFGPMVTERPVVWHGGTIRLGDAEAQVRKAIGRYPDSAQPLYLADQYPIGESWTYLGNKQDRRVLRVEFTRGRVSRVWTERAETGDVPLSRQ